MEKLTKEAFKEKVFDYEKEGDIEIKCDLPCIIDFYADWCGPCKILTPVLEEIAKEYDGRINIYSVDTEDQQELSVSFGIQSIPSLLFVPKSGNPQMSMGALPKPVLVKAIQEILNVNAP